MKFYLVRIIGDTEPEILGPYASEDRRDEAAVEAHTPNDGIYRLDVDRYGNPGMHSYSSTFFDEAKET